MAPVVGYANFHRFAYRGLRRPYRLVQLHRVRPVVALAVLVVVVVPDLLYLQLRRLRRVAVRHCDRSVVVVEVDRGGGIAHAVLIGNGGLYHRIRDDLPVPVPRQAVPGVGPGVISVQGDGVPNRGRSRLAVGLAVQLNRYACRTLAVLVVVVLPILHHRDVRGVISVGEDDLGVGGGFDLAVGSDGIIVVGFIVPGLAGEGRGIVSVFHRRLAVKLPADRYLYLVHVEGGSRHKPRYLDGEPDGDVFHKAVSAGVVLILWFYGTIRPVFHPGAAGENIIGAVFLDVVRGAGILGQLTCRILHEDLEGEGGAVVHAALRHLLVDQQLVRYHVVFEHHTGPAAHSFHSAGVNAIASVLDFFAVDIDAIAEAVGDAHLLHVVLHVLGNVLEDGGLAGLQIEYVGIGLSIDRLTVIERDSSTAILEDHLYGLGMAVEGDAGDQGMFIVLIVQVEGLIGEGDVGIVALHRAGQLLLHDELSLLHDGEVEAHVEVGGAGAVLHVEHLEGVARVVLEGVAGKVLVYPGIVPRRAVGEDTRQLEALLNGVVGICHAVAGDDAGGEIDRAVGGGMDAAQVQHQDPVHVDPQIVVAGEFVDQRFPVHQAALGLHEGEVHGHAEEVVDWLGFAMSCW